MDHQLNKRFLTLFSIFLLLLSPLHAAELLIVVSDRSLEQTNNAAHEFIKQYPKHSVSIRSKPQLDNLSNEQVQDLLAHADVIFIAGMFGDIAKRLQNLINNPTKPLVVTSSDRDLSKLSYIDQRLIFQKYDDNVLKQLTKNPQADESLLDLVNKQIKTYPDLAFWIRARAYWHSKGHQNLKNLIALLLKTQDSTIRVQALASQPNILVYDPLSTIQDLQQIKLKRQQKLVAIIDHHAASEQTDRILLDEICKTFPRDDFYCVAVLSRWGDATVDAIKRLKPFAQQQQLSAILVLQDFVLGGSVGRKQVTELLKQLNVPVLKGIRMHDRDYDDWLLSADGLAWNSVHYRVAMPELQGISQAFILSAAGKTKIDAMTGARVQQQKLVESNIQQLVARIKNWNQLQLKTNKQKRVAIVYYNHPPGRHNIGADNLDVPQSLWLVLNELKKNGYDVGELPKNAEALLDLLQAQGVYLPNSKEATQQLYQSKFYFKTTDYKQWFETLPPGVQAEMQHGPLAFLQQGFRQGMDAGKTEIANALRQRIMGDIRHLVEGSVHPAKQRVLSLLEQLNSNYENTLQGKADWPQAEILVQAIIESNIEGLRGWGEAPGTILQNNKKIVFPGVQFNNVYLGPQPPRGWELNEELLHANTSFPPTHHYLAFYQWLNQDFKADAIIHLGRHSTYEFLPRKQVGLSEDDYSQIIAGDIPGIYPYIVDGVGEGIQAKRRGLAVMIDHLTPPLQTTPLYDDLLQLRQLVETYEANINGSEIVKQKTVANIRQSIAELNLVDAIKSNMQQELITRGIAFEQIDDTLLVHEVGHFLTKMQEDFMPLGLHVFAGEWSDKHVKVMRDSIAGDHPEEIENLLRQSPKNELAALLNALNGKFVSPGKGNDPVRSPEVLPTGRNFHALDSSLLPTKIGYQLAQTLVNNAKASNQFTQGKREAIVLWASDTVRDEGAMVGFGMNLLGIRPVWNSRGIFQGIERIPLEDIGQRRDVLFTTSGLFRDLYANLLVWLDRSVLLAIDASSLRIAREYPELAESLEDSLQAIAEFRQPGNEPLKDNQVAWHWLKQTQSLILSKHDKKTAAQLAARRVFGDAPGAYGAGVNRLVERSGAWETRDEVAQAYIHRMGHIYSETNTGFASHEVFSSLLKNVENTYLGRASNLYGLLDNNDAFDYLGGLSLAVETVSGNTPNAHVIQHADVNNPKMDNLPSALISELRGRFLNPQWLTALMQHDYAGARTMGSEFLEYLWGWQVTNPEIIKSWMWDEVKNVYFDDKYNIGLDDFLEKNHNAHVKANMLAIFLVAAQKGFWKTDPNTLKELANQFTQLVLKNGLPGSGHTHAKHPMLQWIQEFISEELKASLQALIEKDQIEVDEPSTSISSLTQIDMIDQPKNRQAEEISAANPSTLWLQKLLIVLFAGLIILFGFYRGQQTNRSISHV